MTFRNATQLNLGEIVKIVEIDQTHPSAKRLIEFGFTPGQEIELISKTVFNDPLAFSIRGATIALRKGDAESIKVA